MKMNQTAISLSNKPSGLPQTAIIQPAAKWSKDAGTSILATLVKLPHWPKGSVISVIENNTEVHRYSANDHVTDQAQSQDLTLFYNNGFYQSADEFHSGAIPDEDSLFRAIVYQLENISPQKKIDITARVHFWRNQVASLIPPEPQDSVVSEDTESLPGRQNGEPPAQEKSAQQQKTAINSKQALLRFFDRQVNTPNSKEDVVAIGQLIQREILEEKQQPAALSPSGNRKLSAAYYLGLLSPAIPGAVVQKNQRLHQNNTSIILPSVRQKILHHLNNTPVLTNKMVISGEASLFSANSIKSDTTKKPPQSDVLLDQNPARRKKRSPDVTSYDLTEDNIASKILSATDDTSVDQETLLRLKEAISSYNQLSEKNSRQGIQYLKLQTELLAAMNKDGAAETATSQNEQKVIETVVNEYKTLKVETEPLIHAIWIAGSPPDNTPAYIKSFLITYPEYKYNLWVDNSAFGAAKFSSILKNIAFNYASNRLKQVFPEDISAMQSVIEKYYEMKSVADKQAAENSELINFIQELEKTYNGMAEQIKIRFNALFLESMLKMQDACFNYCISKGIANINDESRTDFLRDVLKLPDEDLVAFTKTTAENKYKVNKLITDLQAEFGNERVILQDVSLLESLSDARKRYFYQQEILLRWNYSAASDQLRMYILKEHGGIYTDTDIMPEYSKQTKLNIIFNSGDNRFFEKIKLRRAISAGILNHIKGQIITDVNMQGINRRDQKILQKILTDIAKIPLENIFQKVDTTLVRDTFKMFKRYQLWSNGKWNVRGNSNHLISHKGSELLDVIIDGQQRAYSEIQYIREVINKGDLFKTTDELRGSQAIKKTAGLAVEKYLPGGLFSTFRQDSIIPGAMSTLYISGPDLLMRKMKDYYKSLGLLGSVFLDNRNTLTADTFMGVLKKTTTGAYDWLNPESVGVNDITPDDESTWLAKRNIIDDIFFKPHSGISLENLPEISLIKINKKEFFKLWDKRSKRLLRDTMPDLIEQFNSLLTDSFIDYTKIAKLDQALQTISSKVKNRTVNTAIFSLQLQLTNLISGSTLPVENHINFFMSYYRDIEKDLSYSIRLFLKGDAQTKITLWYTSGSERIIFAKAILSMAERSEKILTIISELKSDRHSDNSKKIEQLENYANLKNKKMVSLLTTEEESMLWQARSWLKRNQDIGQRVRMTEESISTAEANVKLLNEYTERWGDLSTQNQQNNFINDLKKMNKYENIKNLYDIAWSKYISEPSEKRKVLQSGFNELYPDRVSLMDIDNNSPADSLSNKLRRSGYTLPDLLTISRYSILDAGVAGVLSAEVILPAPAKDLINLIKNHVTDDSVDVNELLPFIYDFLNDDSNRISDSAPPLHLVEALQAIKQELTLHPLARPFSSVSEQGVSVFGAKYATRHGEMNDQVISCTNKSENIMSFILYEYLNTLFDIHTRTFAGTIDEATIRTLYQDLSASYLLTDDKINNFLLAAESSPYLSLTEIHQKITGYESLGEFSLSLLRSAYPGVINIMQKASNYGQPMVDLMADSALIYSDDFTGLGLNENIALSAPETPQLHSIVEQAKYNLLSWGDFYNEHARLWDQAAHRFAAKKIDFHPQSLFVTQEGRCMGLAQLYLLADNPHSYKILQTNLMLLSALYQTKHRDNLPLSLSDQSLLNRMLSFLEWLQHQGNKKIAQGDILVSSSFHTESLITYLRNKPKQKLLITTPKHSLTLQYMQRKYRVTDPNFGHADFSTLSDALFFIREAVQLTPTLKAHYGIQQGGDEIRVHFVNSPESWRLFLPSTDAEMTQRSQISTLEHLSARPEPVSVAGVSLPWKTWYELGATCNGQRISESTTSEQLASMQLHGDILHDFLSRTVLDVGLSDSIKILLQAQGIEPGTRTVPMELLRVVPDDMVSSLIRLQRQSVRIKQLMANTFQQITQRLQAVAGESQQPLSVKQIELTDVDRGNFRIDVQSGDEIRSVNLESPGLVSRFKSISHMLSGMVASGAMDFDLGLSVLGIVQYSRMVQHGQGDSALANANLAMNVKQLAEVTLGNLIQAAGNKLLNPAGIQGFRLESYLAQGLREIASRSGGPMAKALSMGARLLELPVLEIALGSWNLYQSVTELQHATRHADIMAARVQVAFDAITLTITVASVAFPPLIIAVGPLGAMGMGAVSIARNIAEKEERHEQWLKYKKFLDDGAEYVVMATPERKLLDFSANQVLGDMVLDLRQSPPTLTGKRSYNSGSGIGHHPEASDAEIRTRAGYAWSYTPNYALAHGYANSYWPRVVPRIPDGNYETIILGYGKEYRANTEVEYLSNKIVWREAVMAPGWTWQPPLQTMTSRSTVIAGDNKVYIAPAQACNGTMGQSLETLKELKDYRFVLTGGKGGMTVQVGGAGYYVITGDATAPNNVLSFRAMPEDFPLEFDLSKAKQQLFYSPPDNSPVPVMTIEQQGIDTIIGTENTRNHLSGNSQDNTFFIGNGGGQISSGGGNNRYIISGKQRDDLSLILDPASSGHEIQFDVLTMDLIPPQHGLSLKLYQSKFGGLNVSGYEDNLQPHFEGTFSVSTQDGITLMATGSPLTLSVAQCDVKRWQQAYPEVASQPEDMVKTLHQQGWRFADKFTMHSPDMTVHYQEKDNHLLYQPGVTYTEIALPAGQGFNSTILGIPGGSYAVAPVDGGTILVNIMLAGDGEKPERIDLSNIIPTLIEGKRSDKMLMLSVTCQTAILNMSLSALSENTLAMMTRLYFNPLKMKTLEEVISLLPEDGRQVALYRKEMMPVADRAVDINSLNHAITWLPRPEDRQAERALRIDNFSGVGKTLHGQLVSGMIKGRWSEEGLSPASVDITSLFIPPYSSLQLLFTAHENVLVRSTVTSSPLVIEASGAIFLAAKVWKEQEEIIVMPGAQAPTLNLQGFKPYQMNQLSADTFALIMHQHGAVRIEDRNLTVTLFYLREERGIGALRLTFNNFFLAERAGINPHMPDGEKIPLMPQSPLQVVNPVYRQHLTLTLGSTELNLAKLVVDYAQQETMQTAKLINNGHTITPPGGRERPLLYTLRLTPETVKEHQELIWITPQPGQIFYLNPQGDLLITRQVNFAQAIVVTFEGYRENWWRYHNTFASRHYLGAYVDNTVVFHENGLHLTDKAHDGSTAHYYYPVINKNKIVCHDPQVARSFSTAQAYGLWELQQRALHSAPAKVLDNQLMALALKSGQWEISGQMLHYLPGYYRAQAPQWTPGWLQAGDAISTPDNKNIDIYLTTEQNNLFVRKGSGYQLYYRMDNIVGVRIADNAPGETRCILLGGAEFEVTGIDESQYHKKIIFLTLKPRERQTEVHRLTPEGYPLF